MDGMDGMSSASSTLTRCVMWVLIASTVLCVASPLLAQHAVGIVRERPEPSPQLNYEGELPSPQGHTSEGVINLGTNPVGTFTNPSATFDCQPCLLGFGQSRWEFTVTVPTDITVEVNDCCVEGDRFEARCNDRNVDEDSNGDLINHEEDCIIGREMTNVPVGTFANVGTVTLQPGDWIVRIRDVQFQCGTSNPGCPAGYTMRISFGPPTGTQCAGLASCFNPSVPAACRDSSLPRDTAEEMLEAKLDALEPQVSALEQKLDQLELQVEVIIQVLNSLEAKLDVIEAKLDTPTPCDHSDPMTCDGECPVPGDICVVVPGALCRCVTPCEVSNPATCDGACPNPGETCTIGPAGCFCDQPPAPCDQSDPAVCDGFCQTAEEICVPGPAGAPCQCITPCELSDPATCDGDCPPPEVCTTTTPPGGPCFCGPPPPCDQSDPATCDGTCLDPDERCVADAVGCHCEGVAFCSDAVNPCDPCTPGTVCPDGTPCGPIAGCP